MLSKINLDRKLSYKTNISLILFTGEATSHVRVKKVRLVGGRLHDRVPVLDEDRVGWRRGHRRRGVVLKCQQRKPLYVHLSMVHPSVMIAT